MAHWAEIDENNVVVQVTVGDNNEEDEGYSWLINNLGGTWIKTSYNTVKGIHTLGGTPLRWNFAGKGFIYLPEHDAFMPPKPDERFILDVDLKEWAPPTPRPEGEHWYWDMNLFEWVWDTEAAQ